MNGLVVMSFPALLALSVLGAAGRARTGTTGGGHDDRPPPAAEVFLTDVPAAPFDVIGSRPMADAITLNVRSTAAMTGAVDCAGRRFPFAVPAGGTAAVLLSGLTPGAHTWRIGDRSGSFCLARRPGETFTFTVQADSHLDGNCRPELYRLMLGNVAADHPDFHIDLGDTFMTGKHPSRESAARQYLAQRYYFGLVGDRVPLFLVLGNHDGEEIKRAGDTDLADWSRAMRTKYFSNPVPDGFYTGDSEGRQNYYAWTWGDALFVVLDPYTYGTTTHGGREPENMTLGDGQFAWLERTLSGSRAKFKFVFVHQLTGGLGAAGRGGAEAARLHQWAKVHELLVRTGVNIVFHGHDHFYARQVADGVVYQLVPQGAARNVRKTFADEYGYREGDFLPGDGHLRVTVAPTRVTVAYVAAATADMARFGLTNRMTRAAYTMTP